MTSPRPYHIDGQDPVIYSEPGKLSICRDPLSPWETLEERVAVISLHVGNVLRQVVRPIEDRGGFRILGKLGMATQTRELIDYRSPRPFRQTLVDLGLVQQNTPNPDPYNGEFDRQ